MATRSNVLVRKSHGQRSPGGLPAVMEYKEFGCDLATKQQRYSLKSISEVLI